MEQKLFEKYGMTVDEGKVFFSEGEEGEHMFIIQEGSVRITKNIDGREHTLAVLGKGDFFGEMAIVTRTKRTASAKAASTVKLLRFDREGFLNMVEKNARIALNVIDKLCRRLQQANMQIQHLVRRNERGLIALNLHYTFSEGTAGAEGVEYAKLLRELSLNLEFPQEKIQKYIAELREKHILKLQNDKLELMDAGRLADIAEHAN
ncbi:MAG: Crp/Fnr family transcriptional regulator [Spirochaetota bacterium]|nr:Crp/Fnr family transcriptional regulator [Spirochaetota bacterium]